MNAATYPGKRVRGAGAGKSSVHSLFISDCGYWQAGLFALAQTDRTMTELWLIWRFQAVFARCGDTGGGMGSEANAVTVVRGPA